MDGTSKFSMGRCAVIRLLIGCSFVAFPKPRKSFCPCSPLTIYDLEDHRSRVSWIGQKVVLDDECPCLYPELPQPRPCPVYPEYSDIIDPESTHYEIPIRGTEDYKGLNHNFDILNDKY
ncbi:hypothetical protein Ocin01_15672 [Orchesella cincta]|uniref:Uncharacterized protein n=1 Tax=Orchesella cincta TaxID=48709 RepID=A0A1D2MDI3_ORCCI|nr:hypothetical protein Ocin01_15672 [Orchesella cincta]